jgi:cytoskeletal protein RodZ
MTSNPPSSKDSQSSILKDTRTQKGISLEMVHEATKVPLDALKAIEQGYSVHRLPPFYYRGFIRIYSKYLELDEAKVLNEYGIKDTSAPKMPPPVAPVVPKETPRPRSKMPPQPIGLPSKDFAKDSLKPLLKRNLNGPRFGQAVKFIVLLIAVFAVIKIGGYIIHKAKTAPRKQPAVAKPTEKKTVKATVKEKSKSKKEEAPSALKVNSAAVEKITAAPAVSEATQVKAQEPKPQDSKPGKSESKSETKAETKAEKKSKRIELTVRATKSGWLQVKADGQIVFQSTLKKGAAETWAAAESIELSGKNINLLEFELNGKLLGALGPSDRGAKRVVFTKDGLSVKK